jgi:hypothetical protein
LSLPRKCNGGDGYLEVHPSFRAIFTSNPQEYAGVHRSQDALSTQHPVLDQNFYVVRLDSQLNVIGCEIKEAERTS